ncbi:MAG: type 1 glutamine amidotransferase [Halobacteriota archaeon]
MILVLDDEVRTDYRYLAPEIVHFLDEAEYHVYADDPDEPELADYDGVVISGSTASAYDADHADWIRPQEQLVRDCVDHNVPLLGICFGHQLVNQALGGTVENDRRRATFVEMESLAADEMLTGVEPVVPVLHADLVTEAGDDMIATARTDYSQNFCTRHASAPVWTVQFHPEFTERVADRPSDWDPGTHSFDECNATRVLENFESACTTA